MLPKSLENNLYFHLNQASALIRKPLFSILWPHKLTPEQWEILLLLQENSLSQKELTALTLKDKGNISRILTRLKIGGWVEAQSSPIKYSLTPTAIQTCKEITKALKPWNQMLDTLAIEQGGLLACLKNIVVLQSLLP